MLKSGPTIALLFVLILLTACVPTEQRARSEFIYGRQLMTAEELMTYRHIVADAETELDRQDFVATHHEKMKARAEEEGIVLPEKAVASKPKKRQNRRSSTGSRLRR